MQTIRVNNLRILSIKNAKFSGYYFYMNLNIQRNFQICISVPLNIVSFTFQEKLELEQDPNKQDEIIMEYAEKMEEVSNKMADLKDRRLKAMRNKLKKDRLNRKQSLYK